MKYAIAVQRGSIHGEPEIACLLKRNTYKEETGFIVMKLLYVNDTYTNNKTIVHEGYQLDSLVEFHSKIEFIPTTLAKAEEKWKKWVEDNIEIFL